MKFLVNQLLLLSDKSPSIPLLVTPLYTMVRTGVGAGDEEEPTFINCVYDPTFVRNCCTIIVFVLSENISICVADSCCYFNLVCYIFYKIGLSLWLLLMTRLQTNNYSRHSSVSLSRRYKYSTFNLMVLLVNCRLHQIYQNLLGMISSV